LRGVVNRVNAGGLAKKSIMDIGASLFEKRHIAMT